MMLQVEAIDHLVLNVRDVEISAAWFHRVLGMRREDHTVGPKGPVRVSMFFGVQKINLRPMAESQEQWFTADNPATGSDDLCFLTSSSPDEVVRHLEACDVEIVQGPVGKRGARGEIRSVYCRDPDGSLIEIASYPAASAARPAR